MHHKAAASKKRANSCPSLGWSSCSKNDGNVPIQNCRDTGEAKHYTGSVADTTNVKTFDSRYLCEAANTASTGLQCQAELVKYSTAAGGVSRNLCESNRVSEVSMGSNASHGQKCETATGVFAANVSSKNYRVRFVYNSRVVPRQVDALLARKPVVDNVKCQNVLGRTVWASANFANGTGHNRESGIKKCHSKMLQSVPQNDPNVDGCDRIVNPVAATGGGRPRDQTDTAKVISRPHSLDQTQTDSDPESEYPVGVTPVTDSAIDSGKVLIYNVNGVDDKFASSILHAAQFRKVGVGNMHVNTEIHKKWRSQSSFDFGYIPIDEQCMSQTMESNEWEKGSPWDVHSLVRATGVPNFMKARVPIKSQLNVQALKDNLKDYWDQQLCQLIEFGFPLDFNRKCDLECDKGNHKSALDFPGDVDAYIAEELEFGAILGPFSESPIPYSHSSPFMTRAKPNSDRRRVIIDLSWPLGASVNAGIDKDSYLGSKFCLTFPTVDHITDELKKLGRGALLYKIDVSRAFRHVKVDPGDYDLLGLDWHGRYVDTCVPFGTRHGSQIFQRLSDGVRYVMRQKGYDIIDYIDDYVGVGVPSVASASFSALIDLMGDLGLTISQKKLVPPSTQVTCLGVLIDTVKGTISIPPDKLHDVTSTVRQWLSRDVASKRDLQSILGLLLYVHKCVKPARIFLNRMLDLLRFAHSRQKVTLTPDFKRDLKWFAKFLPLYNGVSLYDHRPIDVSLELDACLTGLGGRSGNFIYHLPIPLGYRSWTIVHLEMVNILVAVRLFHQQWASKKVLIHCDNAAVVSVLKSGRTRDPYLGACARNVWYVAATSDIDLQYTHVRGVDNKVADALSRWRGTVDQWQLLGLHVLHPVWLQVSHELLELDPEL